ncbi:MAG TPA: MBL fold metallo-hydrolase [Acidimicrobiales bacterium]|nr:MBL fold metallo-hydrolase [Acidimicrobiales bacterium]
MLKLTFHGVRASAPAPGRVTRRYGLRTPCVAIEVEGREPVLLDLGTGVGRWVSSLDRGAPVPLVPSRVHALVTRVDSGHLEGRPALGPLEAHGTRVDVYGPWPPGGRRARPGQHARMIPVDDEDLVVGDAKVMVRPVPTSPTTAAGPTNGYRLEWEGASVAYVSDHQASARLDTVAQEVLELAEGVDLLIHDARLSTAMWADRSGDGHSTVDYAVLVAREAGARCLALFNHDPDHDDDQIDRLLAGARRGAERLGVDEVIAATEGATLSFGP